MVRGRRAARALQAEEDKRREEMEIEYMKAKGLYVDSTTADGNCFFRAMAMALYGSEDRHAEVRQQVCDHMAANSATLCAFVAEGEETQRRARPKRRSTRSGASASAAPLKAMPTMCEREQVFLDHVEVMRQDGEWVDQLEVGAFTSAFRRCLNVFVFTKDNKPRVDLLGGENPGEPLYVSFHQESEHYETVRNLGGPHEGLPNCHPIEENGARDQDNAERAITEDGADKEDTEAVEAVPSAKRGRKRSLSEREDDDGETEVPLAAKKSKLSADTAPASVLAEEAPPADAEKAATKLTASSEARSTTPTPTKDVENAGISKPVEKPAASTQADSTSSAGQKRKFSQRGADGEEQGQEDARPKKAPKPAPRERHAPAKPKDAALLKQQRRSGRVLDRKTASARQPYCSATQKSAEPTPSPVPAGKADAPKAAVVKPKDALRKTATGRVEKTAVGKTTVKRSSPVAEASIQRSKSADTERLPASIKRLLPELKVDDLKHHEEQPERQVESEERNTVEKLELTEEEEGEPATRTDGTGRPSAIESGRAARRHSI